MIKINSGWCSVQLFLNHHATKMPFWVKIGSTAVWNGDIKCGVSESPTHPAHFIVMEGKCLYTAPNKAQHTTWALLICVNAMAFSRFVQSEAFKLIAETLIGSCVWFRLRSKWLITGYEWRVFYFTTMYFIFQSLFITNGNMRYWRRIFYQIYS